MRPTLTTALLAASLGLAACGTSRTAQRDPPQPQQIHAWQIVMDCEQDDPLARMECFMAERPNLTRDARWWQGRVQRLYLRTVGGQISPAAANAEFAGMETRILDARIAADAFMPPPSYASATPIAPLNPNWLGGGYGTPRLTCVPGAGNVSCY